jgi:hypothetical protein
MLSMTRIDPRQTVWLESGYALDWIGALDAIKLPREPGEADHPYRQRLAVRLLNPLPVDLHSLSAVKRENSE